MGIRVFYLYSHHRRCFDMDVLTALYIDNVWIVTDDFFNFLKTIIMKNLHVVQVDSENITFNNGVRLTSLHESDCCENHYLSMSDLTLSDFDDLKFDLSGDAFFRKIEDYGIELIPINGHSVKIPGYGYNNGYYSTNLDLAIMEGDSIIKEFDITECQVISD